VVPLPEGAVPNGLAVDPQTGRIYVTDRGAARLYAIDGHSYAVVNSAPVGNLPWGVTAHRGKVYVADFGDRSIHVVDAATLDTLSVIPLGGNPTFVKTNSASDRVIVVTYGSTAFAGNRVAVIDPASDTLEADVEVGCGGAWGLAINPTLNRVYVSCRDSGTIVALDGNHAYAKIDGQVIDNACVEPMTSPFSMDFDTVSAQLYLACAKQENVDRALIYSAGAGGLIRQAIVPIGNGGADGGGGVVANSATGHAFFTNSLDHSVSVVDGATLSAIATIPVGQNPFGAALNSQTQQVFVGARDSGNLWVLVDPTP
jgi:YVTN family beta-propeller protein